MNRKAFALCAFIASISALSVAAQNATAPAPADAPVAPPMPISKPAGEITVKVIGFQNEKGQLGCVIFKNENGFPMKSELGMHRMVVPFKKDGGTCVFKDIPAGKYAIGVMHDENMNKKVDTKIFGIPTEGWAVSNNAPPRTMGPPKFESAIFSFDGTSTSMTLKLRY